MERWYMTASIFFCSTTFFRTTSLAFIRKFYGQRQPHWEYSSVENEENWVDNANIYGWNSSRHHFYLHVSITEIILMWKFAEPNCGLFKRPAEKKGKKSWRKKSQKFNKDFFLEKESPERWRWWRYDIIGNENTGIRNICLEN